MILSPKLFLEFFEVPLGWQDSILPIRLFLEFSQHMTLAQGVWAFRPQAPLEQHFPRWLLTKDLALVHRNAIGVQHDNLAISVLFLSV